MKRIYIDTFEIVRHTSYFKHIKYLITAATLTTVLLTTGCDSSHSMITAIKQTDADSAVTDNATSTNDDSFNSSYNNMAETDIYDNWITGNNTLQDNSTYSDDNAYSDNGSYSDDNAYSDNGSYSDDDSYSDNNSYSDDSTYFNDDTYSDNSIYSDSDRQPEYSDPNAWINELSASSSNNQLIIVAANGSHAIVSMYSKNDDNTWETIVDTSGYVGVDGVGNASEYTRVTPSGIYSLSIAFGVNSNPGTALPYTQADSSYYWVDDPASDLYNRFVTTKTTTPDWSSAEHIIDYPDSYAYAIAIDYNTSCIKGAGSAIFLHCSNGAPTYGCVSIPQSSMIAILNNIRPGCSIIIDNSYNIFNY